MDVLRMEVLKMKNGKKCILIADDEKDIRDVLYLLLSGEGYEVISAVNGQEVLDKADSGVDLFILDVNMPMINGFMTAVELRKTYDAPIIFLTAYSSESDKVTGFYAGADDYIVKPFSNMELVMRVKAILRRSGVAQVAVSEKKTLRDLVLDLDSQSVVKGDNVIPLTYTEFKILELFINNKKKIFSLDNIYQSVWGDDAVGDSSIMVHIKNIRKKIGDDSRNPIYIKTAWGKGYYVE